MARLFGYLFPYRFYLVLAVLLLLGSKGIEAFIPIYLGFIAQDILDGAAYAGIVKQCLLAAGLLLCSYLIDCFVIYLKSWIGQRAISHLRFSVYQHIESLPLSYFDRHSVGQLMTRTIHDVDQVDQMFSDSVVPLIGNLLLFAGIAIGITFVSWKVAVAIALIAPLIYWLTNHFRYYQKLCYNHIRTVVAEMNSFVQEHLMGAAIIRNFGLQKQEETDFDKINQEYCNAYLQSAHHFSLFIAGLDFLQSVSLVAVFVVLVLWAPVETGFQAGTYFTFSLYAVMFFRPLADLAERYNLLQSAMAAAEKIFQVLDQSPEPPGPSTPFLGPIESIVFQDVWFAYEKENWILQEVSFQMSKGESLAIVGETGAGKTSLIHLLLRLYEFQKGTILLNGRDIRDFAVASVRAQFSVVLQDPVIFSGTIAENISFFDASISLGKLEQEILERFPRGLDFLLTERGKSLSVGEMQLISLERAAAHEKSVLVLDEATANIDSRTEKLIQKNLKKILQEKMALVIAHRLSTIQEVDRILVLHQGRIVESGSHSQLLQTKGVYEKLYRLQFNLYNKYNLL